MNDNYPPGFDMSLLDDKEVIPLGEFQEEDETPEDRDEELSDEEIIGE